MEWNNIDEVLPKDEQDIIVLDENSGGNLKRVFYLEFWRRHNRVMWCSHFYRKWKPVDIDLTPEEIYLENDVTPGGGL